MKTTPATEYPAQDWPRPQRLRKPYTFHRLRIVEDDRHVPKHDPNQTDRDWQLDVHHLKGPIHPHLFRLIPGDEDSISRFAEMLGLDELMIWGMGLEEDRLNEPWYQIQRDIARLTDGVATVPLPHLVEAWTSSMKPFRETQQRLRDAFDYAEHSEGADDTIKFLRDHIRPTHSSTYLRSRLFPHPEINLVTWPIQPIDGTETLAIVESPNDIFARGWLELYDNLQTSGAPKLCAGCQLPFIGATDTQEYCTRQCQLQTHDKNRRTRSTYRRDYERMYQRMRRGTITRSDFDTWKKREGRA